jgi:microcystin-dependent protein
MKRNKLMTGGRPRRVDDLQIVDNQIRDLEEMYGDLGNFIWKGVTMTASGNGANISAGLVYIDSRVLRLDAGSVASFPAYITLPAPTDLAPALHEDGATKPTQVEYKAVLSQTLPATPYIVLANATGGKRLKDALGINAKADQAALNALAGEVAKKENAFPAGVCLPYGGNVLAELIDANTGLGKGKLTGWALADGRNGTVDLRRRFVVGYDSGTDGALGDATGQFYYNYGKVGNKGGLDWYSLTIEQMPSHSHSYTDEARNDGNAGGNLGGRGGTSKVSTKNTSTAGNNRSVENRPPYIVLAWVQKIV